VVGLLVGAGVLLSVARPRSLKLSGANGLAAAPAATPVAVATPGLPAAKGSAAQAHVPAPDSSGRVRVSIADPAPARLPAPGVPSGWEMTEFAGTDASVELVRADGRLAMRLRSDRNSFALHRDLVLDVRQYPMLTWSWKVVRLPSGGDVREPARNDQAAQVYVVFPRWPAPRTSSDVIGYVWDSRAPVGTTVTHPRASNVRIIVLESGQERLDTWIREERNVAEDYRALFGGLPPRAGKVALMIDSNDTKSGAEALFQDLTFSRPGAPGRTETPTTMLR
jgi:hypothetical protein